MTTIPFTPNNTNLDKMLQARKFENEGNWKDARVLRSQLNQTLDVQAIDLIMLANDRATRYRESIEGLEKDWENRKINNTEFYQRLREAHAKIYNNEELKN